MILITGGRAQGMKEYAKRAYDCTDPAFGGNLNTFIKERMENGADPWPEIEEFIDDHPDAVVITEQIGCGIVPMDKFDREYRERTGRIQIKLAERAAEVIRVTCGIGQKIK